MTKDIRRLIREHVLPSHRRIGNEPLHEDNPTAGDFSADGIPGIGFSNFRGSNDLIDEDDPITGTALILHEFQSGTLPDDEAIDLFSRLVSSGLIEFMNTDIRRMAENLAREGLIVMEAQFDRNVRGQPAQGGEADIKVRYGGRKRASGSGPKLKAPSGMSGQGAHGSAGIPKTGGSTNVTSIGHQDFPSSGGRNENPARVPKASGKQKPGTETSSDAGKTSGMSVGHSLYQDGSPDRDRGKKYTGSKVGQVRENRRSRRGPRRRRR